MAPLLAIISAFMYAVSMVTAQVGLGSMSTVSGTLVSMAFTFFGSLLLLFYYVPSSQFLDLAVLFFVLAGLSGPCLGRILLYTGIKRVGSSIASLLYSSKPLFSAIIAVLILDEKMTVIIASATVMMAIGLAVISAQKSDGKIVASWSKRDLIFPLMAGAVYGTAHTLRKIGLNIRPDPIFGVVVQNFAALSFTFMLTMINQRKPAETISRKKGVIFFGLAGIFSLMGQTFLFYALNIGNVVIVSPISTISPVFVIIMGIIFFQELEKLNKRIVAGAILILSGTILLAAFPA